MQHVSQCGPLRGRFTGALRDRFSKYRKAAPGNVPAGGASSGAVPYRNGWAYIRPPLVHRPFRPRSSFSGVPGPTLRSKISA